MDDREHENWQRLKAVFNEVIDLPDVERNAALARISAEQPTIIDELRSLLSIDTSVNSFLDEPVKTSDAPSMIGEAIGHYRITRELGRGGMGAVFEAEREDGDFDKRVAIKLTGHNIFSEELARRFRNEKQILAKLEHPNIVRLFDGGITANHIPYYVMEYVEGTPITRYCREKALTTRERLQLFVQVLDAVSYAHRRLVVHRDLKPSNILVTDEGTVKLLDFGIAKALDIEGGTQTSAPLTPEYAAPEQIARTPVSTATDIYSLGILLFEMLTELPPAAVYRAKGLDVYRAVIETEPSAPSAAVTLAEREKNEEKQIDRGRLAGELRGDLDNIVLKCLGKEPESRYASADQLLADIEAFLAGRPVSVHPQSRSYRLKKFVGRNRLPVAAASMAVLLILAGLGMALYQWSVARQNQLIAEQRFQQVRKVANSLIFDYHDEISKLEGSTALRERLVTDAVAYLDAISQGEITDPELLKELGIAYRKIGDVQGLAYQSNLGKLSDAIRSHGLSVDTLNRAININPDDLSARVELSASYYSLSDAQRRIGRLDDAERSLDTGIGILPNVYDIGELGLLEHTLRLLLVRTDYYEIPADRYAALDAIAPAYSRLEKEFSHERDAIRQLGRYEGRRGNAARFSAYDLLDVGDIAGARALLLRALEHYEKASELFEGSLDERSGTPTINLRRFISTSNIAKTYVSLGDLDKAEKHLREAKSYLEKMLKDTRDSESRIYGLYVANIEQDILIKLGKSSDALSSLDRSLSDTQKIIDDEPENTETIYYALHFSQKAAAVSTRLGQVEKVKKFKDLEAKYAEMLRFAIGPNVRLKAYF
ncbi:MAG: serine/threonine protein kinase [Acidobacteria bacterium]|nr:serine/threonine protein kinase [Acidobacteriota bacterium]